MTLSFFNSKRAKMPIPHGFSVDRRIVECESNAYPKEGAD